LQLVRGPGPASTNLPEDELYEVAKQLQVSADAVGWRLHSLGRIDEAARVALSQFHQAGSDEAMPELFSRSFVEQLHVALDKGRLFARKAAKTLGFAPHELTQLFEAYRMPAPFFL
jgi:Zn-dependent peptidase ImmA (M78 family)